LARARGSAPPPDEEVELSSDPNLVHLSNNHRDTLLQIFQHPTSHNIEWHGVLSLLRAVGDVEERKDAKFLVSLGGQSEFFVRPKNKDVDVQQVLDLRRMLTNAGYDEVVKEMEARGKEV
jgi:hypothetical protein